MSWYYAKNGKELGPVSESEFQSALADGNITADTLVWREGLPQWKKYSDVAVSEVSLGGPAVTGTFGSALCVECNHRFPQDEMVQFGEHWVCAGCKPQYVQKIKEGVTVGRHLRYGGFWIRFCAKFVDGLMMTVVNLALNFSVLGSPLHKATHPATHPAQMAMTFAMMGFEMLLGIAFITFFLGKFGATPGKMLFGLKVVRPDGAPLTYGRAFGRYWAEMLSGFTLYIGYLMVAWDPEKRGLHDRVADTRVVYKP